MPLDESNSIELPGLLSIVRSAKISPATPLNLKPCPESRPLLMPASNRDGMTGQCAHQQSLPKGGLPRAAVRRVFVPGSFGRTVQAVPGAK